MSVISSENEVLHRIRVKLYPNYLPGIKGSYVARTDSEASLTVEQVCAALKNRGGFTGNYKDLVDHVRQFLDETAYQLCDGFVVRTKYFSLHPSVGGTFNSAADIHDHEKHPLSFRLRARHALRDLARQISVEVEGVADANSYIDEFIDVETQVENDTVTPDGLFIIHGHKIKVMGEDAAVGVYFVNADDPSEEFKIDVKHLAENASSKIIGIVPALSAGKWRVEARTQYSGSTTMMLKSPRIISASFTLTAAQYRAD